MEGAWRREVARLVDQLPARFSLADVYRFIPQLHEKFPNNRYVPEKIRQTLQVLQRDGKIRFLDARGTYENLAPRNPEIQESLPFRVGQRLRRDDLARLLEMDSIAALRRGMFRRDDGPYQNHLILFHDEKKNPYGDLVEGERVRYVGQGRKGDQKLKSYNRYLADHLKLGFHVQYFVQPRDARGEIVYKGELVLEGYQPVYRADEDRSVYEFHLVPASFDRVSPLNAYGAAYDEMLESVSEPAFVDRPRQESLVRRVVRGRAFQTQILFNYANLCAVCGEPLARGPTTELQAAHIAPVSERGPDDPRNGISLCVRHHWAFDNGFFSVRDDFTLAWLGTKKDPHGEANDGTVLHMPESPLRRPHPLFLAYHRRRAKRIAGSAMA